MRVKVELEIEIEGDETIEGVEEYGYVNIKDFE